MTSSSGKRIQCQVVKERGADQIYVYEMVCTSGTNTFSIRYYKEYNICVGRDIATGV